MFERIFPLLDALVHRHPRWVLWLVLAITAVSGVGLLFTRYEGNISLMLPPNREVTRSMEILTDSSLSDKMIVSLALTDPGKSKADLFLAVDQLAGSLSPPLFTKVVSGLSVAGVMEEFSVLRYAPQVLTAKDLERLDGQINADTVSRKLRGIYLQSMRPESIFTSTLSRSDPLGIKLLLLERLRALPASMGFEVSVEDGHFVSRDGRHAMLIIQTPVPIMDGQRSKLLVATLQERIQALPPFVKADIISGHLHTVSNEKVVKRDIQVLSLIASVTFLLLFVVLFRDARALFVFAIPLIAVVWAIVAATAIEGRLSYLVIGFGTAIAGISIDYGLLVYIALKRGAGKAQMVKLAKLVTVDAATSVCSFGVLYFSLIRGYHQLALFSMLCVIICLLFSLLVLPLLLAWKRYPLVPDPAVGERLRSVRWPAKSCIAIWAVLTAAALCLSFSVQFDSDVKKLDGSEPGVLRAERNFHAVWGGASNQAIFVVNGASAEEAMQRNDEVYREASQAVGSANFTSLAQFWSSERQRRENCRLWDCFWRQGRELKLKGLIRESSARNGFAPEAFAPFFDGLYAHQTGADDSAGMIAQLRERFLIKRKGSYSVLSYFPDDQACVAALSAVADRHPGSFIVSGKALSASISAFTAKEIKVLAPLAVLFNVVLAWLFFRNWRDTAISLVPLVTGVVWLVGIMSLFGIALNVVNVVAAVVCTGVIVDYGLGITYEYRNNLNIGTVIAVTLSAATNVIGAGALLFARHPALYSTGVAMVICMVAGYLSSVIVVPSLCSVLENPGRGGRQP